jgi:hypothetical protein
MTVPETQTLEVPAETVRAAWRVGGVREDRGKARRETTIFHAARRAPGPGSVVAAPQRSSRPR